MKNYDLPKKLAESAIREADSDIRKNHARGIFDDGDPNNPKYNNGINYLTREPLTIFGYETDGFMARQYMIQKVEE